MTQREAVIQTLERLGGIATLGTLYQEVFKITECTWKTKTPQASIRQIVQRSSTIDVIWFNQRNMPDSFFEVEHSTDIQNSLLKFEDLIDFSARMFIVADSVRKEEFQKKMNYDAFKILKDNKRVDFLSYEDLDKQYAFEISKQEIQTIL